MSYYVQNSINSTLKVVGRFIEPLTVVGGPSVSTRCVNIPSNLSIEQHTQKMDDADELTMRR
jgi:hypothetical protein